jgi:hypothetical protein
MLATSPPSLKQLSGQRGILNISLLYRTPQPVTGDSFTFVHVADVRASQEAQTFTTCYRDSFTLVYVADVRTSQEAQTSTACYGDCFTVIYIYMMFVSNRKHRPPLSVTGIALLSYM